MSSHSHLWWESSSDLAYVVLRTGAPGEHAWFYPSLYQIALHRDEEYERVNLGYSGSRILERLLQTIGELVTREELLRYAWSDRVVSSGSLNQQIYVLRKILKDEEQHGIIQTLPRRGYMLNPRVVVEPERNKVPALIDTGAGRLAQTSAGTEARQPAKQYIRGLRLD